MSDVDADSPPRSHRVLTGLFWTGVGLAPLAGVVLLLGGGSLAAVLGVLTVVLIGLSITLRPDAATVRAEMEKTLLEEIDMLREDMRGDITTAARATHQAFEERTQTLQRTVDSLRAELEAVRAGAGLVDAAATGHAGVGHVPAGHAGVGHVPAGHAGAGRAAPPPSGRQPVMAAAAVPAPGPAPASPAGPPPAATGRAHVPAGVFRHTETVHHVTTRSTFVDRDDGYQGGHSGGDHSWSVPPPRSQPAPPEPPPEQESWTDQKLRERYGRRPRPHERAAAEQEPERGRGRRRRWDDEPDGPPSGADQGRWAGWDGEDRGADRGAELRLGQRRAAVHTSEAGTELRVEDRWAAVRRDWDAGAGWGGVRDQQPAAGWGGSRGADQAPPPRDGGLPRREPQALPPGGEVPSWNADWNADWDESPARQPAGRRRRADDSDGGYAGRRRLDFELSDERWR